MTQDRFGAPRSGVARIDAEHEQMLAKAREILEGPRISDVAQDPVAALRYFQRHVLLHFDNEEKEMAAVSFPAASRHREEHRRIADFVASLSVEIVTKGLEPDALSEGIDRLCVWLVAHIQGADRELCGFLRLSRSGYRQP